MTSPNRNIRKFLLSPRGKIRGIMAVWLFLSGCSRFEEVEKEKLRKLNCKAERIYRTQEETVLQIELPPLTLRPLYPWESQSKLPRITKEFFRCKGSPLNLPFVSPIDSALVSDCQGSTRHGLPILDGKENVYPILVELLNYLQKKTGKKVVITSGHCCPAHNTYIDPSKENRVSKHQIGAEVDFYVQGMEDRIEEVRTAVIEYYEQHPSYKKEQEYFEFKRLENSDWWVNKEVALKIFGKEEGRDKDNLHSYPYLCIQVRYDRERKEKVAYNWARAHQGYPRF